MFHLLQWVTVRAHTSRFNFRQARPNSHILSAGSAVFQGERNHQRLISGLHCDREPPELTLLIHPERNILLTITSFQLDI